MDGVKLHTPAHVAVVCYKCTRRQLIPCDDEPAGDRIAHDLGWRGTDRGAVCPKCPGGNSRGNLTLEQAIRVETELSRLLAEHAAASPAPIGEPS